MRLDEESGTATEDEEDVRARELRKQEVWLKVPPKESDTETGSETEVKKTTEDLLPSLSEIPSASSDKLSVEAITGKEVDVDINRGSDETQIDEVLKINLFKTTEANNINLLEHVNTSEQQLLTDVSSGDKNFSNSYNGDGCSSSNDCSNSRGSASRLVVTTHDDQSHDGYLNFVNDNYVVECETSLPDLAVDRDKNNRVDGNTLNAPTSIDGNVREKDNLPDLIASSPDPRRRQSITFNEPNFNNEFTNAKDLINQTPNQLINLTNQLYVTTNINANDNKNISKNDVHMQKTVEVKAAPAALDSFDILKQELRLRRDKKNAQLEQLRPLSKETARTKMNQYFEAMRKEKLNNPPIGDEFQACNELEIKAHMSNKIDKKDLQKYFKTNSGDYDDTHINPVNLNMSNDLIPMPIESILDMKNTETTSPVIKRGSLSHQKSQLVTDNLDKTIQRISVIEKEIILPKETITMTQNIILPKRPERKRVTQEPTSSKKNENETKKNLETIKDNIPKIKLENKASTSGSNRSITSLKFGKNSKKVRGEQEAIKKDKCTIS